ncbi:DNA-3-methyladenine glycosylase I [Desulfovibrio inopinatus]|uniref:DNA-3-methyladenine glycosylase I n=1 Tax=Desulfovibrio inopinatus TaxID=102109 RepID=UPI0003F6E4E3|nr:DNA-3-methyladenine glycosylase I [Desulfovibrio inopinatus]
MSDAKPEIHRCLWALRSPEEIEYHDVEWGVPVHDERRHFEFLVLECSQAGLSWLTILRKREHYRKAFANFDPLIVANYGAAEIETLLANPGLVRNRRKLEATVKNARAFLALQETFGSFDHYIWSFTDGRTLHNEWKNHEDVPTISSLSDTISKDMKKRGFGFVGSTTLYAHLQAIGVINDHLVDCFRYEIIRERAS